MEKTRKRNIEDHFRFEESRLETTLEDFLSGGEARKKKSKLNLVSLSGIVILVLTGLYLIDMYVIRTGLNLGGVIQNLPLIAGVIVFFAGLGVFTENRRQRRRQKNRNYSDNEPLDAYGLRQKRKLYRSEKEKMIFGVCGGLAEYFNIDPTIIRVIFVLLTLSYGSSILVYLVLAVVLPKQPLDFE